MTAFFMDQDAYIMTKIALIYMGGTIGCIGEPLSPMPETTFIPHLQHFLALQPNIECFQAPVIKDSSACTAEDWLKLIQQIQSLQQQNYQHFIVLHGTDTLSYAAALLAQCLQQSCHVILTGSQYPLLNLQGTQLREFTDAVDNLNTAVQQIERVAAGVYLAFHHQVYHAQTAFKAHTTDLYAFRGLPAEQSLPNRSVSPILSVQLVHLQKVRELNILNWMIMPTELHQLELHLHTLQTAPPHFLILQAFGTGNLAVNANIIEQFKALQQQGCCIILATQVVLGQIDQRYAISQWVKDAGLLLSDSATQADLYAKIVKIYLQYPTSQQWHDHWYNHPE